MRANTSSHSHWHWTNILQRLHNLPTFEGMLPNTNKGIRHCSFAFAVQSTYPHFRQTNVFACHLFGVCLLYVSVALAIHYLWITANHFFISWWLIPFFYWFTATNNFCQMWTTNNKLCTDSAVHCLLTDFTKSQFSAENLIYHLFVNSVKRAMEFSVVQIRTFK